MKKRFFVYWQAFILAILFTGVTQFVQAQVGQGNFRFLNPTPFGSTITYMSYVDNNNGLMVGSGGAIAKTVDGGKTWQWGVVPFLTPAGLRESFSFQDVHFVTPTVAYAVGDGGLCVKSIDGGLNWTPVITPLYESRKNINAVWFINKDTGYIGGQSQIPAVETVSGSTITNNRSNPDAAPKLYFTHNGGATWDSISAPIGDLTLTGLVANPSFPPLRVTTSAWGKEIYRIKFVNSNIGYVIGSANSIFERVQNGATTTTLSTGNYAPIVWKFTRGQGLRDYSPTKEKLGYSGINTLTPTTTTTFNTASTPCGQTYKAFAAISDSSILMTSFNNIMIMRISTGRLDSTSIPAVQPEKVHGKYEVMHINFPPVGNNPIPATGRIPFSSNVVSMDRAPDGTIYFPMASASTIVRTKDNGGSYELSSVMPASTGYPTAGFFALDVTPNGRVNAAGFDGAYADSTIGATSWASTYKTVRPGAGFTKIDFADCNNGVAAGGFGAMFATTDGGRTWTDRTIASFAALNWSITGVNYVAPNKLYFCASFPNVGNFYSSPDQGVTNDLIFKDPLNAQLFGSAIHGNRLYVVGHRPTTQTQRSVVFRSLDGGLTWDTAKSMFPTGTAAIQFQQIEFPTPDTGYIGGTFGRIYRTTDGGTNWTPVSIPALASLTGFSGQVALGAADKNTLFYWTLISTTRYMFKSTDAGATWTQIPHFVPGFPETNLTDFVFHDLNNIVATCGQGRVMISNNGGSSWRFELAATGSGFGQAVFVPKTVPAGTAMTSRKLLVAGTASAIVEFGNPSQTDLRTTESATNASCTDTTGGRIVVTPTGGVAPYQYSVNGGAFQSSNTFTGLKAGTYTVVIREQFGCQSITKTVTVGFTDNLTLTVNPSVSEVCVGGQQQLIASSATGTTYAWSPATGLSATNIANPVATVNAAIVYTVRATLGTCTRTATATVNLKPAPFINAGPDKTVLVGDAVTLNGSGPNGTQSIAWSPATGIVSGANSYTPSVAPTTTTTYTLTVRDFNGCIATDNALVTVLSYCVKPMEAFTPNGDGINDLWLVTSGSQCATKISANVFNRYGNKVFESNNYQNNWNGTYEGKPLPDGTYYFMVRYTLINGTVVEQKGNVTILR